MEQYVEENCKIMKKITLLSDSVTLNQKIVELKDHPMFNKTVAVLAETEELVSQTNKIMERDLVFLRKEFDKVMRDLRAKQADLVNCLLDIKKRKIAKDAEPKTPHQMADFMLSPYSKRPHSKQPNSMQKHSHLKQVQLKFADMALTPKMSIQEYKESPLVKKVKLNCELFDLQDFDVHITPQQFESIPKYMRGRVSHDELQHFLEYTIVPCFNEKYKLLHRKRAAVQHTKEFELWKVYQSQISYVQGRNFITAGDISRKLKKMIDKKTQNFLVMIRHLGILQEQRISQTICYIWIGTA